jgi:hypothetical protein
LAASDSEPSPWFPEYSAVDGKRTWDWNLFTLTLKDHEVGPEEFIRFGAEEDEKDGDVDEALDELPRDGSGTEGFLCHSAKEVLPEQTGTPPVRPEGLPGSTLRVKHGVTPTEQDLHLPFVVLPGRVR